MEQILMRQIRLLRAFVIALMAVTAALVVNVFHPFLPTQHFKIINAERLNIREPDGTLKLILSNANRFKGHNGLKTITFAGLIFLNQEGEECGGLTYDGTKTPDGQRGEADLTLDQFHQDQNGIRASRAKRLANNENDRRRSDQCAAGLDQGKRGIQNL
jgi:hypothetical protein